MINRAPTTSTTPGVPILDVLHTSFDQDGDAYDVTHIIMRADRTGLLHEAPVD